MLKRAMLRGLVVAALRAASTLARARVYENRDWPVQPDQFPIINVESPKEHKESLGRAAPQFNTTVSVVVGAQVQATTWKDTSEQLDAIAEQIQRAVVNYTPLMQQIQQFAFIQSEQKIDAEGLVHTGFLSVAFGIETYEGPEDFWPIPTDPLEGIDFTVVEPDETPRPGLCINLPQE